MKNTSESIHSYYEIDRPSHPHIKSFSEITEKDSTTIGTKGLNLALMRHDGVPVPPGVIIMAEPHARYQATKNIDPQLITELNTIRQQLGGKVALRSCTDCEDGTDLSMAGVFDTLYLDETHSLEQAMQAIYEQANSPEVARFLQIHNLSNQGVRMFLILQQLIPSERSGVMYTGVNGNHTYIQYADGLGADLVDGHAEGSSILLNEQGSIIKSKLFTHNPLSASHLEQLQDCARKIQQRFGPNQDIEFACENGTVHIVQARTLTTEIGDIDLCETPAETLESTKAQLQKLITEEKATLHSETVIFSDSNFSELLPTATEMDFGIFAHIFTGSDGIPGAIQLGRQAMGYPLGPESVGYMHYIGGKPYFSLAKDAHTFYAGFPASREEYQQTLVTEYLEAVLADPEKGEYPEMGLYLQDPTLEDLQQRYGDKAEEYFASYQLFKQLMAEQADTFVTQYYQHELPTAIAFLESQQGVDLKQLSNIELVGFIRHILEHLRTISCVNFVKSARLGFYYSQRLQALLHKQVGLSPEETEVAFAQLNQGLVGSAITDANQAIATAPNFEEALAVGKKVVGHYSTGEMLEIHHPRLKDDPHSLRSYVDGIYGNRDQYLAGSSKQQMTRTELQEQLLNSISPELGTELEYVMTATQTYMTLRETVKYYFVAEYALIRDALEELATKLDLPAGDVYSLFPKELLSLAISPETFTTPIRERQQAYANYSALSMPPVIREQDVENLQLKAEEDQLVLEMIGKFLAQGETITNGVIVNIEDQSDLDATREIIELFKAQAVPIILVASQMNLSHDPLIVEAQGLIIENASLVSHGAHRARELGRGAIGGIKTHHLKTGERVIFDPQNRTVTKVSEGSP